MSTRSFIGRHDSETGHIVGIYCHHDGYPEHNGHVLVQHYSEPERAEELISLGDMVTLKTRLDHCEFFHRDRGESWIYAGPTTYHDFDQLFRTIESSDMEYVYIFTNNGWTGYTREGEQINMNVELA